MNLHMWRVIAGWIWEYVVWSPVATIGKYNACANYCSGTRIGTQCCCDEKQIAHFYWLLTKVFSAVDNVRFDGKKEYVTAFLIYVSNFIEAFPIHINAGTLGIFCDHIAVICGTVGSSLSKQC